MDKKEIQIEIINTRTENAKTFDIGNGKRRAEICIGAVHYKDDYNNASEQFKNIDLTWVDNKITKAPYILERIGSKIVVTDKKTGNISSIEMESIGDVRLSTEKALAGSKTTGIVPNVDVEIIPLPNSIRYQTIIRDENALADLKYKITGDIPISYAAVDADGEAVPLNTSVSKEGILTESVDVQGFTSGKEGKTAIRYPLKVDPILTIQGDGMDTYIESSQPTTTYGSSTEPLVFEAAGGIRRMLVKMPLTSLPAGSIVTRATFSAYYNFKFVAPEGITLTATKIRRMDWEEMQATWDIFKTSNNWGTAGCSNTSTDIDTTLTATAIVPTSYGWIDWNVKNIVDNARAGAVPFNIRISGNSDTGAAYFHSREEAVAVSLRPKLVIEYASAASFIPGIMQHNFIPSFTGGK